MGRLTTVTASARVPHDLARQCLLSMPFDSDRAVKFLNQARKILEFQSTIDILKGSASKLRSYDCSVRLIKVTRSTIRVYYAPNRYSRGNRQDLGQGQEQQLFEPIRDGFGSHIPNQIRS